MIIGYDEKVTRIPNEQLANRRISNTSRVNKCQVLEKLKLRHADLDKITPVCNDILENIKKECPELISDGSRPFRATLREIHSDHLLVVVDAHFNIPCIGQKFWTNKDKVLQIICQVLRKHEIALAVPKQRVIRDMDSFDGDKSYSSGDRTLTAGKSFWWGKAP